MLRKAQYTLQQQNKEKKLMSINMELMRKKLAALRGEGDREQSVWFKPDEGDQDIRIIPTSDAIH